MSKNFWRTSLEFVVLLAIVGAVMATSGCGGKTVLLRNEAGETARCEVGMGSTMVGGVWLRNRTIANCVEAHERAGFKVIGGGK